MERDDHRPPLGDRDFDFPTISPFFIASITGRSSVVPHQAGLYLDMDTRKLSRYQLFGRTEYSTPLEYVATLELPDPGSLNPDQVKHPGTRAWVELVAFPEAAVIRVIPWGRE